MYGLEAFSKTIFCLQERYLSTKTKKKNEEIAGNNSILLSSDSWNPNMKNQFLTDYTNYYFVIHVDKVFNSSIVYFD